MFHQTHGHKGPGLNGHKVSDFDKHKRTRDQLTPSNRNISEYHLRQTFRLEVLNITSTSLECNEKWVEGLRGWGRGRMLKVTTYNKKGSWAGILVRLHPHRNPHCFLRRRDLGFLMFSWRECSAGSLLYFFLFFPIIFWIQDISGVFGMQNR